MNARAKRAFRVILFVSATAMTHHLSAGTLVSVDFNVPNPYTASPTFSGVEPAAAAIDPLFAAARVWNGLNVPYVETGADVNPAWSGLVDSTGSPTAIGFSIEGNVLAWSFYGQLGSDALRSDYFGFNSGGDTDRGISTNISWSLTGLIPNATYDMCFYGARADYSRGFNMMIGATTQYIPTLLVSDPQPSYCVAFPGIHANASGTISGLGSGAGSNVGVAKEGNLAGFQIAEVTTNPTPEPGSLALIGAGMLGLAAILPRRRRQGRSAESICRNQRFSSINEPNLKKKEITISRLTLLLACLLFLSGTPMIASPIFKATLQQIQGAVYGQDGTEGLPDQVLSSTTEPFGSISTSGSGIDSYGRSYSGSAKASVDVRHGLSLSFYSSGTLSGGSPVESPEFIVTSSPTIYETYTISGGPVYVSATISTEGHGIRTSGNANASGSVANISMYDLTVSGDDGGCVIYLSGGSQTCSSGIFRLDNSLSLTFAAGGFVNLLQTDASGTVDYWGTVTLNPLQIYDQNMNPIGTFDFGATSITSTPEPGSLGLIGAGMLGLAAFVRRRPMRHLLLDSAARTELLLSGQHHKPEYRVTGSND